MSLALPLRLTLTLTNWCLYSLAHFRLLVRLTVVTRPLCWITFGHLSCIPLHLRIGLQLEQAASIKQQVSSIKYQVSSIRDTVSSRSRKPDDILTLTLTLTPLPPLKPPYPQPPIPRPFSFYQFDWWSHDVDITIQPVIRSFPPHSSDVTLGDTPDTFVTLSVRHTKSHCSSQSSICLFTSCFNT